MYCERRLYSKTRVTVRVTKVTPQNCLNCAQFGKGIMADRAAYFSVVLLKEIKIFISPEWVDFMIKFPNLSSALASVVSAASYKM